MQTTSSITTLSYPVMESFYTLQGEGYHQGRAAWFVRLGGCDVGCVWCDVPESWDASKHPVLGLPAILQPIQASPLGKSGIVVITGGEPLMHDCTPLTQSIQAAGFCTHIETSGSHPLSGQWDWICVSPKKFKKPLPSVLEKAHELKVIVFNKSDFEWAEAHAAQVNGACKLYLQPEWSKRESMTPLIVDYIKNHPRWELSLQLHKYINVP
jgi:7-carboxy-7-deazaguanine synthase